MLEDDNDMIDHSAKPFTGSNAEYLAGAKRVKAPKAVIEDEE